MKLLLLILLIVILYSSFNNNQENMSILQKIKNNNYNSNELKFLVKIDNNYYNLYNLNKNQFNNDSNNESTSKLPNKFKNYQNFINYFIKKIDDNNIQNHNLDSFIKASNILDLSLIVINNKSNKCKNNRQYGYKIPNINNIYYIDGFNNFLKSLFYKYKKYGKKKLLSTNYFIKDYDLFMTKIICDLNQKTGIPDKYIKPINNQINYAETDAPK